MRRTGFVLALAVLVGCGEGTRVAAPPSLPPAIAPVPTEEAPPPPRPPAPLPPIAPPEKKVDEPLAPTHGAPDIKTAEIAVVGMKEQSQCPLEVRKALEGEGVLKVEVNFDRKSALVTYDAADTTPWIIMGRLTSIEKYADSTMRSF